jgi:hypothetical protein
VAGEGSVVVHIAPAGVGRLRLGGRPGRGGQRLANQAVALGDAVRTKGGDYSILVG